jgi:hypothetical protein
VLLPARQTLAVALVVWVDGWQMQCCGTPFAVGSQVAWTLGEADYLIAAPMRATGVKRE